jgi:predicted nucleic acid-binding protein
LKFILDASVYISFYSPSENQHETAKILWALCGERDVFHVPQIFILEVLSGFARRRMDVGSIREQESFINSGPKFVLHPLNPQIMETASTIIKSVRLRSADAVYLALAHELKGTLLTLDSELMNSISRKEAPWDFNGSILDPILQNLTPKG